MGIDSTLTPLIFLLPLVFARVLPIALVVSASLTQDPAPKLISIALALVTTAVLAPTIWPSISHTQLIVAWGPGLVLQEICVGIWLGAFLALLFLCLRWSGSIYDMLFAGHPKRVQAGPMSHFLPVLGTAIFLLADGHQLFLDALILSYVNLPLVAHLPTVDANISIILSFARLFSDTIQVAVLIALPILGFALVLHFLDVLFQTVFDGDRNQPATEQLKRLILLGLFLLSLEWTLATFLEWAPETFHRIDGALALLKPNQGG
jgi:flagellar biosynthesis protein FliR